MTVEDLLTDTLHRADDYVPSSDLFTRVRRSIAEAEAHRRRVRRIAGWTAAGLIVAAAWVGAWIDVRDGAATMPWWTVEVMTVAILIVTVITLGPLIRRFGRGLTLEVFRSNQATSEKFLRLLDIAYYLVFGAYIIMTVVFQADPEWGGRLVPQIEGELIRVGLLLLLMGVLHAATIAVLPVMGLIFASNWRRAARRSLGEAAPTPDPEAEKADRVATIIVWVVVGLTALQALFLIGPGVLGLILGAE